MATKLSIILKDGFLYKKGGLIKSWSRRYFVLSPQSLCYFRSEEHQAMEPLGRIFLSDIVSISTEGTEKKKAFVFVLHTKKRALLLQAANNEDRDKWVQAIKKSLESDQEAENEDPFRKTLRRLTPGIKRVTLFKDAHKGIGCTIKNAAGHIFVNKIMEDGPIAETGILRPGDELLEINGHTVTNLTITEVADILRESPSEFLATVRPVTSVHKALKQDFARIDYADIVHFKTDCTRGGNSASPSSSSSPDSSMSDEGSIEDCQYAVINKKKAPKSNGHHSPAKVAPFPPLPYGSNKIESLPSFEDVGNYDDEDEGDVAPPLPPWTEDCFILVDPPPSSKPKINIYKTNAHLSHGAAAKRSPYPLPKIPPPPTTVAPRPLKTQFSSPVHQRRSPPHLPPTPPPKLYKAHSQGDGLDQIDSRPPVPPRHHRHNPAAYYSPGCPRRAHQYEDIDKGTAHKKTPYIDLEFSRRKIY